MRPLALTMSVMAIGCLGSIAHAAQTESIQRILDNPERFRGRTVEVRGVINQCSASDCRICDDKRLAGKLTCIWIWRWANADSPVSGDDRFGDVRNRRAQNLLDRLYRFTTVRLRASVGHYSEEDEEADAWAMVKAAGEFVGELDPAGCRGRGCKSAIRVWLDDARIQQVYERTPATSGLLTGSDEAELKPASAEATVAMAAAVDPSGHWIRPREARAYSNPETPGFGWLCHGLGDVSGSGEAWPSREGHLARSPANDYVCWPVDKEAGTWVLRPFDNPPE